MKKSRKILKNVKSENVYKRTLTTVKFLKLKKYNVIHFVIGRKGMDFLNDTYSVLFELTSINTYKI
jgi:F0F1-type ATP synthase gamma subunit